MDEEGKGGGQAGRKEEIVVPRHVDKPHGTQKKRKERQSRSDVGLKR